MTLRRGMMAGAAVCKEVFRWSLPARGENRCAGFATTFNQLVWSKVHTMKRRTNLFLRPLLASVLSMALVAAADSAPWSETFTMPIGGQERTFIVYHGGSYMVLSAADALNKNLLLGRKDVVTTAKFERDGLTAARQRLRLSSFPEVVAEGDSSLFATRLEGDNLYLFGTLTTPDAGKGRFEVMAVEAAPSDAQIIAKQLDGIPATDYPARLKAAAAIREHAATQPNKEFWLSASDNVVLAVIDDAAAAAEQKKDVALANQAITWAVEILHDPTKAGRVGSTAWIRSSTTPGTDEIVRRLRHLGLELYKDQWRPRGESLSLEFEDRFAAIQWKDADSYYRLGRWADLNGETLPRSKDRSYRCYQAGYRANPNHQGIRNELGLPNSVRGDGTQAEASADFQHAASGTLVPAPRGWKRGERIEGDITWIDPDSETSYLAAAVITVPQNATIDMLWSNVVGALRAKPEFAVMELEEPTFPQGLARRMRYQFRDGKYLRQHEMLMALNPQAHIAVRLDAGYADEDQQLVHQVLISAFDRLVIPNLAPNAQP